MFDFDELEMTHSHTKWIKDVLRLGKNVFKKINDFSRILGFVFLYFYRPKYNQYYETDLTFFNHFSFLFYNIYSDPRRSWAAQYNGGAKKQQANRITIKGHSLDAKVLNVCQKVKQLRDSLLSCHSHSLQETYTISVWFSLKSMESWSHLI